MGSILIAHAAGLPTVTLVTGAIILILGLYKLLKVGSRDKRLPPGPPTVPILGNLHLIPKSGLGLKYVALKRSIWNSLTLI